MKKNIVYYYRMVTRSTIKNLKTSGLPPTLQKKILKGLREQAKKNKEMKKDNKLKPKTTSTKKLLSPEKNKISMKLNNLPQNVLRNILNKLPAKNGMALGKTSKNFRSLYKNSNVQSDKRKQLQLNLIKQFMNKLDRIAKIRLNSSETENGMQFTSHWYSTHGKEFRRKELEHIMNKSGVSLSKSSINFLTGLSGGEKVMKKISESNSDYVSRLDQKLDKNLEKFLNSNEFSKLKKLSNTRVLNPKIPYMNVGNGIRLFYSNGSREEETITNNNYINYKNKQYRTNTRYNNSNYNNNSNLNEETMYRLMSEI